MLHEGTITTSITATVTPAWAAATTAGSLGVVCIKADTDTNWINWSLPAGWLQAGHTFNGGGKFVADIWYKPNLSASESNPACTSQGQLVVNLLEACIFEVSGADTSSPLGPTGGATGIPGTSPATFAMTGSSSVTATGSITFGCIDIVGTKSASITATDTWSGLTGTATANLDANKNTWHINAPFFTTNNSGSAITLSTVYTLSTGTIPDLAGVLATFLPPAVNTKLPNMIGATQAVKRAATFFSGVDFPWKKRRNGLLVPNLVIS